MGSIFGWKTRDEIVAYATSQDFWSKGVVILATRVVGSHVWQAIQLQDGRRMVSLVLILHGGGEWGYKGMDETMGPVYYDCPLSLLELVGDPIGSYAVAWREKVRAYHAAKKAKRTLHAGDAVEYGGRVYRLAQNLGRKGWLCDGPDGARYRMNVRQLADATLVNEDGTRVAEPDVDYAVRDGFAALIENEDNTRDAPELPAWTGCDASHVYAREAAA
jgi:hypothetical protein